MIRGTIRNNQNNIYVTTVSSTKISSFTYIFSSCLCTARGVVIIAPGNTQNLYTIFHFLPPSYTGFSYFFSPNFIIYFLSLEPVKNQAFTYVVDNQYNTRKRFIITEGDLVIMVQVQKSPIFF